MFLIRGVHILLVALLTIPLVAHRAFAGGPHLDSTSVIFSVRGDHDSSYFGYGHLSFIGDVNGDDFDDLAIRRSYPNGFNVYYGGDPPDTVADVFLRGRYGPPAAVDMDADGIEDVVITEEIPTSPPGAWIGQLLIYKGFEDSLSSVPVDSIRLPAEEYQFCVRFEVSDLDGDPFPDFLATSQYSSRFMLFHGPLTSSSSPDWVFDLANLGYSQTVRYNPSTGQGFGFIDWNGDGDRDIYMGAYGDVDSIGYVWVFLGPTYAAVPDIVIGAPSDQFPSIRVQYFASVAANIGDIDNDGYDDIGIGYGTSGLVYFGGPGADTLYDVEMESHAHCMLNIGDFNADGYSDLYMGRGQFYEGSADFHMGGPRFDGVIDDWIDHLDLSPWFLAQIGLYAAAGGDFNRDGVPDVAIGCNNYFDIDRGGVFVVAGTPNVVVPVAERPAEVLPVDFQLYQNYPNPFNPTTTIAFTLPVKSHVEIDVFNVLGQRVTTLVSAELPAGSHSVVWEGTDTAGDEVASGVYVYRLTAGDIVLSRKMVLAR